MFNWLEVLEIGVNFLELPPSEVGRLTPEEFTALVRGKLKRLGIEAGHAGLSWEDFADLEREHPDGREYDILTREQMQREVFQ